MRPSWKIKLTQGSARWGVLAALVLVEIGLLAFLRYYREPVSHAFLIKSGKDFVVFYSQDGQYESATYSKLKDALTFAKEDLGLVRGSTPAGAEIERLWTQDRFGSTVVLWKTYRHPYLNQLTFTHESEAKYFAEAFRKGAYTPCPFGHSVLLLPITQ